MFKIHLPCFSVVEANTKVKHRHESMPTHMWFVSLPLEACFFNTQFQAKRLINNNKIMAAGKYLRVIYLLGRVFVKHMEHLCNAVRSIQPNINQSILLVL